MKRSIFLLILLLAACSPSYPSTTATPTFSFTATPNFTATPILPSITPTSKPLPLCPKLNNPNIPVVPSQINFSWVRQTIINYLNQGGDPEKLVYELTTLKYGKYGKIDVKMDKVDINSDGVDELIFSSGVFLTTISHSEGVDSGLWVFQCENGNYKIPYQIELLGGYSGNPRLAAAVDLNNDNRKEIVIRYRWQGSGCHQFFNIASWKKDNLYPTQLFSDYQYFPCDTDFVVGNKDSNGNREILFTGESDIRHDSVAYIRRDFIDTYKLNVSYVLKSHEYLPSPYRVYAIYDAQQALDKGDVHQAIQLYDQAVHDETLQDIDSLVFRLNSYIEKWPQDLPKQDYPKEYVSAFSLFRLTVLYFEIHEESKAMSALKELETSYPNGKFGVEFTNAAQLYIEQRKDGNKPFESCQAVSSLIENKYPYLNWHFQWSTWTSFDYTNQTLCPYSSEK